MFCVRGDNGKPQPMNVVNEVVSINNEDMSMEVLVTRNDLYGLKL